MNEQILEKQYESLGISKEVYAFGKKIEDSLKERFAAIDASHGIQSDESDPCDAKKQSERGMF